MKTLKRAAFILLGMVILVLMVASVVEKAEGTRFVSDNIYGSVWFVALWALTGAVAIGYMFRRKLYRRPAVFMLHAAFAVILVGAGVTWLSGEQGTVHLRVGQGETETFLDSDGMERQLPFGLQLDEFRVEYYPGTSAPMDFVSEITVTDGADTVQGVVAMNRIFRYCHYRFYQSSYDADGQGCVLSVAHDPWGIGITYTGYGLLLLSVILFFFDRNSGFRKLLKTPLLKGGVLCVMLCFPMAVAASPNVELPPTLPRSSADRLGSLYVYYQDRICPLSTLAKDFTVKLYGKPYYKGYTPEQVVAGWLFWYDEWKEEPVIRVKSAEARRLLDIDGRYAALSDYRNAVNAYRLEGFSGKGVSEADEKFNLVAMLCTGSMLRIFPYTDMDGELHWASQIDRLPSDMDEEQELFIRGVMNYIHELVVCRDYSQFDAVVGKLREYQIAEGGCEMPSEARFAAERLYGRLGYTSCMAFALVLIGVAAFIYICHCMVAGRKVVSAVRTSLTAFLVAGFVFLTFTLALRWFVSGHMPLSNGFETMQFLAWSALGLTLLFHRRLSLVIPFGYLTAGLALMVSMMGESNPQITNLMPVLASPLLCVHVVLVMLAYALLAFVMFNGITGIILYRHHPDSAGQLGDVSRLLLYPAVFCLAAGIFIGAVWANVSWGRYWGWDPKEVWALITMLVYSLALHPVSLPLFRRPLFFHWFCVAAFLCVLITYFGVNFLLGGMHSYA